MAYPLEQAQAALKAAGWQVSVRRTLDPRRPDGSKARWIVMAARPDTTRRQVELVVGETPRQPREETES